MKKYYLFIACASFICGEIFAASAFFKYLPAYLIFALLIIFFILAVSFIKKDIAFVISLMLLVFSMGTARYYIFNKTDSAHIRNYASSSQKKVFMKGEVASDPSIKRPTKKAAFVLNASLIKLNNRWVETNGFALVNMDELERDYLSYGDIVLLEGFLKRPFSYKKRNDNFDYLKYLANKRIYSVLKIKKGFLVKVIGEDRSAVARFKKTVYSIRAKLESHIENFLEPPYSDVFAALLLGVRHNIPQGLNDIFMQTGTLHILAISGLQVGMLYFVLRILLKIFRISGKISIILSISFLAFFAILTGSSPSILRSAIMFSVILLGELFKRKISVYNLIGLSCFSMLFVNPNQLFETSFILSYAAILSLVSMPPFFQAFFPKKTPPPREKFLWFRVKNYFLDSCLVSFAVWIGLLPILAYYFGLVTPIIVIANIIVIPLLFFIMGAGVLFISFGLLSKFLAVIFAQSTHFFIFLLIKSVKFLKNIPLSYFKIDPPRIPLIFFYYLVLISALIAIKAGKQNTRQDLT